MKERLKTYPKIQELKERLRVINDSAESKARSRQYKETEMKE